uniref:Trehalase n=1 Tax=Cacopsylla melanoneura TaxID=428564 RepID=A0A8D8TAE1_9HEMI
MFRNITIILAFIVTNALCSTPEHTEKLPPPCDNDIYCYGPLLHAVQMASVFPDSKTFVDMKLRHSPDTTWRMFNELMNRTENRPTSSSTRALIHWRKSFCSG